MGVIILFGPCPFDQGARIVRLETFRPQWSFFAVLCLAAFGLNWLWENVQTPAYVEMARRPWWETMPICTLATLGDVAATFAICVVGALGARDLRWGTTGKWNVYATAALMGRACAVAVEWKALASGWWSYTNRMPIVAVLGVGLWPVLQLTLLVPAAMRIAHWWTKQKQAPGST